MDPQPGSAPDTGRATHRRQAIIRAAAEVFLDHGYLGATTDDVAARASVSKQTVYKHFANKQHLFAAVITETTAGVAGQLTDIAASTLDGTQDVRKALRELAGGWLHGMLRPDVLRLRRLVIAEAERFPEVGRAWYDRALVLLGESLQRLAGRGLLRGLGDRPWPPTSSPGWSCTGPSTRSCSPGPERPRPLTRSATSPTRPWTYSSPPTGDDGASGRLWEQKRIVRYHLRRWPGIGR